MSIDQLGSPLAVITRLQPLLLLLLLLHHGLIKIALSRYLVSGLCVSANASVAASMSSHCKRKLMLDVCVCVSGVKQAGGVSVGEIEAAAAASNSLATSSSGSTP